MRTPEERRDERREYQGDVWYDVWRSGGNPDRVNEDRVEDSYYQGMDSHRAAERELKAMRPRIEEPEFEQEEQQ